MKKRQLIEEKQKENGKLQEKYKSQFQTKKKLKKAAKDIIIYQKAKERAEELSKLQELGNDDLESPGA